MIQASGDNALSPLKNRTEGKHCHKFKSLPRLSGQLKCGGGQR